MSDNTAQIHSIQVGRIETQPPNDAIDRPWVTAFYKTPVPGPILLGPLGLAGDQQADKRYHGGPDNAVLAYALSHYPLWQAELNLPQMPPGGFGENLTITQQTESTVCIGDTYRIGQNVIVQVSSPRGPCSKIDRRWNCPGLSKRVGETQRNGWYLRVLHPGQISPSDTLTLLSRPHAALTIAAALTAHAERKSNPALTAPFLACPELSTSFKKMLQP